MARKPSGRIVESMAAAASVTKIPISLLKQAKRAGCPAFKSARVNLDVLDKWMKDNRHELEDIPIDKAKLELVNQQVARNREYTRGEKLANDIKEGKLIEISVVREEMRKLIEELKDHFRRIEDELPRALQGLSLAEQRLKIRERFDAMQMAIHSP